MKPVVPSDEAWDQGRQHGGCHQLAAPAQIVLLLDVPNGHLHGRGRVSNESEKTEEWLDVM